MVIAAGLPIVLLTATGTGYRTYFEGTSSSTSCSVPPPSRSACLWRNRPQSRRNLLPMCATLIAGSITAIGSAVLNRLGARRPREILASLAAEVGDRPIAMASPIDRRHPGARRRAGRPHRHPRLVIVTPLMNALRIRDYAARGFAVSVASHGIGTARAFQVSEEAGTFPGIAMGLNGALTALLFLVAAGLFLTPAAGLDASGARCVSSPASAE